MAVKTEYSEDKLYRITSSDEGKLIRKIGTDEIYEVAEDLIEMDWQYEETDEYIETLF